MNKILFLDLDGTARRTKSGATFINTPLDQEIIPGVREAIARYSDYHIIGITNQGGVLKGKKSLEDCIAEQKYTMHLCPEIKIIYFCPDEGTVCWSVQPAPSSGELIALVSGWNPSGTLEYRKPDPGMVNLAIQFCEQEIQRQDCLMVGDRSEDEQCAAAANIPFMWAVDWRGECD
jgi:D-glycero-D-manno-heptose 1,7-bisphosphate phosphatase